MSIKDKMLKFGAFVAALGTAATLFTSCGEETVEDPNKVLNDILSTKNAVVDTLNETVDKTYGRGSGVTYDIYEIKDYSATVADTAEASSFSIVTDASKNGTTVDATFTYAGNASNYALIKNINDWSTKILAAQTSTEEFDTPAAILELMGYLNTLVSENTSNCTITETSYKKEIIEVNPMAITTKIVNHFTASAESMKINEAMDVLKKAQNAEFNNFIAPIGTTTDKESNTKTTKFKFFSEFAATTLSFDVAITYSADAGFKPSQLKELAIKWLKGETYLENATIEMDTNSISSTTGIGASVLFVTNQKIAPITNAVDVNNAQ